MGKIWLVLLMHTMDDFPIRLFKSEKEAREFVKANPIYVRSSGGWYLEWYSGPEVMRAYDLAQCEAESPIGYKICCFRSGRLVSDTIHTEEGEDGVLRHLDEDEDGKEVTGGEEELGDELQSV